jgi:hypothetical protein
MEFEHMDWIYLVYDRGRRWSLVNTVMIFIFHKRLGIF